MSCNMKSGCLGSSFTKQFFKFDSKTRISDVLYEKAYHNCVPVNSFLHSPDIRGHCLHVHGNLLQLDAQQLAGFLESNMCGVLKFKVS